MKNFTAVEERELVRSLYDQGHSMLQIHKDYSIPYNKCRSIAKELGLPLSVGRRITDEMRNRVIELFKAGVFTREIAAETGICRQTITKIAVDAGLPTSQADKGTHRKHGVNDTFFDVIDTEEKAYWLGVITADGSVGNNSLTFTQKQSDRHHVELFRDTIGSTQPVSVKHNNRSPSTGRLCPTCVCTIYSQRLVKSLLKHGLYPNKSLTVEPSGLVPDDLMRHYYRGLVDGDGTISRYSIMYWAVGLVGSYGIVSGFADFVNTHNIPHTAKAKPRKNIFDVRFSGKRALAVAKLLYSDASVYLPRKYARYEAMLDSRTWAWESIMRDAHKVYERAVICPDNTVISDVFEENGQLYAPIADLCKMAGWSVEFKKTPDGLRWYPKFPDWKD